MGCGGSKPTDAMEPQEKGGGSPGGRNRKKQNQSHSKSHEQLDQSADESLHLKDQSMHIEKQKTVKVQRFYEFLWDQTSEQKSVEIKTLMFSFFYDTASEIFRVKTDVNQYTTSDMHWETYDQGNRTRMYNFIQRDLEITELESGATSQLDIVPYKFEVTQDGRFTHLLDVEALVDRLLEAQNQDPNQIDRSKKALVKDAAEKDLAQLWKTYVENWLKIDVEDEKADRLKERKNKFGVNCLQLQKSEREDPKILKSHIERNMTDRAYIKKIANISIKNHKAVWNDESVDEIDQDGKEKEKIKFLKAESGCDFQCLSNEENLKPIIAQSIRTRKIIFTHTKEDMVAIDYSMDMMISMFCWPELSSTFTDDHHFDEFSKFRELAEQTKTKCKKELQDLHIPIA